MQEKIERLRSFFLAERARLFDSFRPSIPGRALMERYSDLVDEVVQRIFAASGQHADSVSHRSQLSGLAIIATGGYGRRELNPYSDIDIAFVPAEEDDPWVEAAVHSAFRLVMDVFLSVREIHVGYSYRPIADAPTWDLNTRTALLDARHICGDAGLVLALSSELRRHLSPLDLYAELRDREAGAEAAPHRACYAVVPELKQGSGSLRDLHRGRWILRLLADGTPEADLWQILEARGYLSRRFVVAVRDAAEWFWRARNWLHLVAGRRCDTILAEYQDRLAGEYGFCSSQAWLSEHYRHAEVLFGFCQAALRRILQGPLDYQGVRLERGCLRRGTTGNGSLGALRLLSLSQESGIPMDPAEVCALEELRPGAENAQPPSRAEAWIFLNILRAKRNVSVTLRRMVDFGLLDRFVEGFSLLMRYAPPDPSHRWTVGEHSLRIIRHLERLREGLEPSGQRFAELARECTHFDMLVLAALIHDAGKMSGGEDHSESGHQLAGRVADSLELPPEKRELLELIVRHHLLLVRTARLQDLKSAAVIQSVADRLRAIDVLRHLYVFSYADTQAVSEKSWTSMDYLDLEELYSRALALLAGPGRQAEGEASLEEKLGQVRRKLAALSSLDEATVRSHCDSMPAGYILNTPLEKMAVHIDLMGRLEAEDLAVDIYNRPGEDFSEVTVCAYDDLRPGFLAKIAGLIYACDSEIVRAQVFTLEKSRPMVLDTLWVRSGGRQLSENRAARIRSGLRDVLLGRRSLEDMLLKARKAVPEGAVVERLEMRNDLSEEHTVIHIIARDLRGLLYLMTRAISQAGLHIHSAKVATWGARAENNFSVTDASGKQLSDSELPKWQSRLAEILEA